MISTGILLLILLTNVAILAVFLGVLTQFRRIYNDFQSLFVGDEAHPAPASGFIASVAHTFAQSITREIKTTLMGLKSGQVRAEQAVMEGVVEEAMGDSPLGAIAGMFPGLTKKFAKNPALLQMAMGVVSRMSTAPKSNGGSIDTSSGSDFGARLAKYGG